MRVTESQPKVADVLDLIRALRKIVDPIKGELAFVVANIIHEARIDNMAAQIGNAYFRCRACDEATDCNGEDEDELDIAYVLAGGRRCSACGETFVVEDLRICEGWVEQIRVP